MEASVVFISWKSVPVESVMTKRTWSVKVLPTPQSMYWNVNFTTYAIRWNVSWEPKMLQLWFIQNLAEVIPTFVRHTLQSCLNSESRTRVLAGILNKQKILLHQPFTYEKYQGIYYCWWKNRSGSQNVYFYFYGL